MSVWRGRPPVLAEGINDSNRAHCASVRSLGNPLPDCLCASRCSLVHIPNHGLPILAETVNHAALDNATNFWVRLSATRKSMLTRVLPLMLGRPEPWMFSCVKKQALPGP